VVVAAAMVVVAVAILTKGVLIAVVTGVSGGYGPQRCSEAMDIGHDPFQIDTHIKELMIATGILFPVLLREDGHR
jgi:hypothetical protein